MPKLLQFRIGPDMNSRSYFGAGPRALSGILAFCAALPAQASMFSGDTLDAVANGIAWFVLAVVPIVVIALFWIVHVMPEKIAHKNHHPQAQAIHTLCLLSLVFGGLLWPLAWLWAYTKPVSYRMAYGTDKHDNYYHEMSDKAGRGELVSEEIEHLRHDLDNMAARGTLPPKLRALRAQLDALPGGVDSPAGTPAQGAA
jgi:CBS domain containing-hemolysin-like protein